MRWEVGESGGYSLGRGYSHQLVVSADRLGNIGLCHPHSLGKDKESTWWEGESGTGPKQLPLVLDLPAQKGHPLEEGMHLHQETLPRWQCLLGWQAQGPWRSGPVAKPVWDFHQFDLESRKTGKGVVTLSRWGGGKYGVEVKLKHQFKNVPHKQKVWAMLIIAQKHKVLQQDFRSNMTPQSLYVARCESILSLWPRERVPRLLKISTLPERELSFKKEKNKQ